MVRISRIWKFSEGEAMGLGSGGKSGISKAFAELQADLEKRAPHLNNFNSPASEFELRRAEQTLGFALPDALKEFYQCQNGELPGNSEPIFEVGYVLRLIGGDEDQTLVDEFERLKDMIEMGLDPTTFEFDRGIREELHDVKRVPITTDYSGNYCCFDGNPGPKGTVGQIIFCDFDSQRFTVLAKSIEELLKQTNKKLKSGEINTKKPERFECIIPKISAVRESEPLNIAILDDFNVVAKRVPLEQLLEEEKQSSFPNEFMLELYADNKRAIAFTVYDPEDDGIGHTCIQKSTKLWLEEIELRDDQGKTLSNGSGQQYMKVDLKADAVVPALRPVWSVYAERPIPDSAALYLRFRHEV